MLVLVAATLPGPFLERTALAAHLPWGAPRRACSRAMAGGRMYVDGWTEISAVCTPRAFRDHRFASRWVNELIA
jgi:hypothetical protein